MLHPSWQAFLDAEFQKPYFKTLSQFLSRAYATKTIYPAKPYVFSVFTSDLSQVSVVILGQDPYHTPGAAHGLAFSVPNSQPIPPSLVNIYKEIDDDIGQHQNPTGYLKNWQDQGVFLLNNVLTVEAHRAGSHRGQGWEIFTEAVIKHLNETRPHLVFMLWGRDARSKKPLIDSTKHLILESPHPSPLSAYQGFFGNRHFSQANAFLEKHHLPPIIW